MAIFRYEGYDQTGKAKRGTVEAGDQNSALVGLRSQGVNATRVEPVLSKLPAPNDFRLQSEPHIPAEVSAPSLPPRPRLAPSPPMVELEKPAPSFPGTAGSRPNPNSSAPVTLARQPLLRTNAKLLALWYRNLASLIDAGTGIGAALESMAQAAPTPALRSASRQMAARVQTGVQLSELMPSFPGLFSPLHYGITAAGERGGFLVASFERLANYCERDYELQTMVKRETWYPKLIAGVTPLLSPTALIALFMGGGAAWWAQMSPIFVKVAIFAAIWYGLVVLKPFIPLDNPVKAAWDRIRLYIPLVSGTVRGLSTAKFCRAYAALYSAGVGPGEAIRLAGIACGNLAIKKDTLAQIPKIERGMPLTEALRATNRFPPLALQMVQIGEQSGDLDVQLDKAAQFLESDAETTIRKAVPVIGIAMFLAVAFFLVLPQLITGVQDYGAKIDNISDPDAK